MLKQFKFENIAEIDDGSLVLAINKALHQLYLDCESRPMLGTARELTLKISLSPDAEGRDLKYVRTGFKISKSMPPQGVLVVMKPGSDGLVFMPEISDNPDQRPLNFENGDRPPAA